METHILVSVKSRLDLIFNHSLDYSQKLERLVVLINTSPRLDLSDEFVMDKMINAPIKSMSNYTSGYADGYKQAITDILNTTNPI